MREYALSKKYAQKIGLFWPNSTENQPILGKMANLHQIKGLVAKIYPFSTNFVQNG